MTAMPPSYEELATEVAALREQLGRSAARNEELARENERLRVERDERRAQLEALVESMPFDFWMIGDDGRYVLQNEASREHWGSAVGRSVDEIAPNPRVRELWRTNNARALAGETVRGEVRYADRDYHNVLAPYRVGGLVRGIVGINLDVTDTRRLAAERERMRRLEMVGNLAAGLAHDFNNLLAAILGNLEFVQSLVAPQSKASEALEAACTASEQARALTAQLLVLSRGGPLEPRATSVELLLRQAARLLPRDGDYELHLTIEPDLRALADPGQLTQAVHNLLLNARQAMSGGGATTVVAERRTTREDDPRLPPGEYVVLSIADRGAGIAPENLERVFDPYFTTRQRGHGLGLAVVQSVIQRHGGDVRIRSAVGTGTTVELWVPAADPSEFESGVTPIERRTSASGRVLIVDDDPMVRDVLARLLVQAGFAVEATDSSETAEAQLVELLGTRERVDVALIDLKLADGDDGVRCLKRLRSHAPDLPAVAITGHAEENVLRDLADAGFAGSLAKPVRIRELVLALRAQLRA